MSALFANCIDGPGTSDASLRSLHPRYNFGRGNTLYYEVDAAETRLLGYRRKDVTRAVQEIVAAFP